MKRSTGIRFAAAAAVSFAATLPLTAGAQQVINLTIGSSHPATLPWVSAMQNFVVPETNKRLEAAGNRFRINWREAYGGVLYKANATLTSIQDGIADVGWVFTNLEGARMPLAQVSNYAPGTVDDPKMVSEIFNDLMDQVPALRAEWDKHNAIFLGAMAADSLQLFTKFPVRSLADLRGKRLTASGTIATWLQGLGVTPVDSALPSMYNDLKTGIADGSLTVATGVLGIKLYEVAPFVTRVNLGTFYAGALAINKNSFNKLPPEVQKVITEVGREYTAQNAALVARGEGFAYKTFAEVGGKQNPPVTVTNMSQAERETWIRGLPNIAQDWVKAQEAKGLPARQVLVAFMDAARKRGAKPVRDWDK